MEGSFSDLSVFPVKYFECRSYPIHRSFPFCLDNRMYERKIKDRYMQNKNDVLNGSLQRLEINVLECNIKRQ